MTDRKKYLYLFIDESGNFDFSPSGTKYFTLTCLSKYRPFRAAKELIYLKYDLIEEGLGIEYFHASEDHGKTRNKVFDIITDNLKDLRIDTVLIEKNKTVPALYKPEKFYPMICKKLLSYVLGKYNLSEFDGVIIFTDAIPNKKKRKSVEKAIKLSIHELLNKKCQYKLFHHDSKSNFDLQIVDYMNWAIYRKWTNNDSSYYDKIKANITSELDLFEKGNEIFY